MDDRAFSIKVLTAFGHDPAKAVEIAIDVERGDKHAIPWLHKALEAHWDSQMNRLANA